MDKQRYWLVWVDDTPVGVEQPLTADRVAEAFNREVTDDPTALVEVKMCTRDDLDWANITNGVGSDELDEDQDGGENR